VNKDDYEYIEIVTTQVNVIFLFPFFALNQNYSLSRVNIHVNQPTKSI